MVDGLFTFGMLETVEVPKNGPEYANDTTPVAPMGVLLRHNARVFRYVGHVHDNGDDCVAGCPVYWYELDPVNGVFEITPDINDALLNTGPHPNACAGVSLVDDCPAPDTYGWIQVGGLVYDAVVTQGAARCDLLYGGDFTFGYIDEGTPAVHNNIVGVVISAVTSGKADILLQNLMW